MVAKASTFSRASRVNRKFVPSVAQQIHAIRPMAQKRLSRLRMNWFIVGTAFGVGLSFFMNFMFAQVVLPGYRGVMEFSVPELARVDDQEDAPDQRQLALSKLRGASEKMASLQLKQRAVQTGEETLDASQARVVLASLPDVKMQPAPERETGEALSEGIHLEGAVEEEYTEQAALGKQELQLRVAEGDTLLDMLLAQKVPSDEAYRVVRQLREKVNPRSLKVGQEIQLTLMPHEELLDKRAVSELAIRLPNFSTVELARVHEGGFEVASLAPEFKKAPYRAIGTVSSSLYQAAAEAGIPMSAMHHIVKAFSYDVDFQRDIHPGDKIEVLLDRKTTDHGEIGGYSDLRYAALTLRGKRQEIYRYKDAYGHDEWYDARGHSVRKSLLRTPVNAARISSGFGMRHHPVLGYSKMHQGVDFAAPTGTPIFAAGDGVVDYRARWGGYGNYLRIRHNGTYSTAYAHISRFHPNVHKGSRVKQGQVVAYVGSTGRSTGAHLHYEVIQNGKQVNPRAQRFNTASELAGNSLKRFEHHIRQVKSELARLEPFTSSTQLARAELR